MTIIHNSVPRYWSHFLAQESWLKKHTPFLYLIGYKIARWLLENIRIFFLFLTSWKAFCLTSMQNQQKKSRTVLNRIVLSCRVKSLLLSINQPVMASWCQETFLTESAHWAYSVSKLQCPSVYLCHFLNNFI